MNVPEAIQEEILCRVSSVKDLQKSRRVCRSWKSIIDSDYFKKKHFEEAKLNPNASSIVIVKGAALNHLESTLHFWYPNNNNNHYSQQYSQIPFNLVQFLENDNNNNNPVAAAEFMAPVPCCFYVKDLFFKKFGAVNGLVCLGWDLVYVIWNPFTNQYKTFKGPPHAIDNCRFMYYRGRFRRTTTNHYYDITGFGYDPVSQDYKLLTAYFMPYQISFRPHNKTRVVFYVYSLRNNSWMPRRFTNFQISIARLVNGDGYIDDGKFYWFAKCCGDNGTPRLILFDFTTNAFSWMPLPQALDVVHEAIVVGNSEDLELLTTFIFDGNLRCEVWRMQKNDNEQGSSSWSRKCRVELPCEIGRPVGLMKGSGEMMFEVVLVEEDDSSINKELLLINPRTQFCINLGFSAPHILVFNFLNSLFSVDLPVNEGL